jgi:hypothetical protein
LEFNRILKSYKVIITKLNWTQLDFPVNFGRKGFIKLTPGRRFDLWQFAATFRFGHFGSAW